MFLIVISYCCSMVKGICIISDNVRSDGLWLGLLSCPLYHFPFLIEDIFFPTAIFGYHLIWQSSTIICTMWAHQEIWLIGAIHTFTLNNSKIWYTDMISVALVFILASAYWVANEKLKPILLEDSWNLLGWCRGSRLAGKESTAWQP